MVLHKCCMWDYPQIQQPLKMSFGGLWNDSVGKAFTVNRGTPELEFQNPESQMWESMLLILVREGGTTKIMRAWCQG